MIGIANKHRPRGINPALAEELYRIIRLAVGQVVAAANHALKIPFQPKVLNLLVQLILSGCAQQHLSRAAFQHRRERVHRAGLQRNGREPIGIH